MDKELGEQQAVALPAREHLDRGTCPLGREQEVSQVADDVARLTVQDHSVVLVAEVLLHGPLIIELVSQLVEVQRMQLGSQAHVARLRLQFTEQEAQQGGLAATVGPDYPETIPTLHLEAEVVDDGQTGPAKRDRRCLEHPLP